jgi:hypothetical protein
LPAIIRLGWRGGAEANTLAYYDMTPITTLISFIVQEPVSKQLRLSPLLLPKDSLLFSYRYHSIHIERATSMYYQGIAYTTSSDMGIALPEDHKLECFK